MTIAEQPTGPWDSYNKTCNKTLENSIVATCKNLKMYFHFGPILNYLDLGCKNTFRDYAIFNLRDHTMYDSSMITLF